MSKQIDRHIGGYNYRKDRGKKPKAQPGGQFVCRKYLVLFDKCGLSDPAEVFHCELLHAFHLYASLLCRHDLLLSSACFSLNSCKSLLQEAFLTMDAFLFLSQMSKHLQDTWCSVSPMSQVIATPALQVPSFTLRHFCISFSVHLYPSLRFRSKENSLSVKEKGDEGRFSAE